MSDLTVSALFTIAEVPATGLTLSDIKFFLTQQDKNTGGDTVVWDGTQVATIEIDNVGMYTRILATADLNTYSYFAMVQYIGATVLDNDYVYGSAGQVEADTRQIEGIDATNQVRDAILSDATPFAGANINATINSRATPAQVATELATYDAPTYAELVSEINSVQTDIAALNDISPAEVNSEVDQALADINLDHLVGTATSIPAVPSGTYLDQIMDDGTAAFDRTTDSLQAIADNTGGEATLSAATLLAIAKAVLKKGIASMEDDGDFEVASIGEMILGHFESSVIEISPTTGNWVIRKVGGTTFNTRPVTLDETALPLKGVT